MVGHEAYVNLDVLFKKKNVKLQIQNVGQAPERCPASEGA